jgi:hypothetical protein
MHTDDGFVSLSRTIRQDILLLIELKKVLHNCLSHSELLPAWSASQRSCFHVQSTHSFEENLFRNICRCRHFIFELQKKVVHDNGTGNDCSCSFQLAPKLIEKGRKSFFQHSKRMLNNYPSFLQTSVECYSFLLLSTIRYLLQLCLAHDGEEDVRTPKVVFDSTSRS